MCVCLFISTDSRQYAVDNISGERGHSGGCRRRSIGANSAAVQALTLRTELKTNLEVAKETGAMIQYALPRIRKACNLTWGQAQAMCHALLKEK